MLKEIVEQVIDCIKGSDIKEVFPTYDGLLLEHQGRELVTFVGINGLSAGQPVYSSDKIYCPFTADILVKVTVPQYCNSYMLYDFFCDTVLSRLVESELIYQGIKSVSIRYDSNINRLALDGIVRLSGIFSMERRSAE